MRGKQDIELSAALQDIDGPISGDMRQEIRLLGQLVPLLPDNAIRDGRRAVLALADCCIRVHGLETVAHIETGGDAA